MIDTSPDPLLAARMSTKGRFVAFFMRASKGKPVAKYVRDSLDKLADEGYSATGPSFPPSTATSPEE